LSYEFLNIVAAMPLLQPLQPVGHRMVASACLIPHVAAWWINRKARTGSKPALPGTDR
jgi:hypothetical protein